MPHQPPGIPVGDHGSAPVRGASSDPSGQNDALTQQAMQLAQQGQINLLESQLQGSPSPELFGAIQQAAQHLHEQGQYQQALNLNLPLFRTLLQHYRPERPEVTQAAQHLTETLTRLGRYAEAQRLCEDALKTQPPGTPQYATSLYQRACLYHLKGEYPAAQQAHEAALSLRQQQQPPDPLSVAQSLQELGRTLCQLGQYEEARTHQEQALRLKRDHLPPNSYSLARACNALAESLFRKGEIQQAKALYDESLGIHRQHAPDEHPDLAESLSGLARCLQDSREYKLARSQEAEALAVLRRFLPLDHPAIAIGMNDLAVSHSHLGHHHKAIRLFEETLAFLQRILPPNHPNIVISTDNLAASYRHLKRLERLEEWVKVYEEAQTFRVHMLPADHSDSANNMPN